MSTRAYAIVSVLVTLISGGIACRGDVSQEPPIHLNPNMDTQKRFNPQVRNAFFEDQRAMRPQVAGTIAHGELQEDDAHHRGKVGDVFITTLPITLDAKTLHRGQERYNIFCAPCHDQAGTGQGMIAKRGTKLGMVAPSNLHDERLRAMSVGEIFNAITNGVRTMPSYKAQISVDDRWAIVGYVRALQVSRNASISHVPGDIATQKGWAK